MRSCGEKQVVGGHQQEEEEGRCFLGVRLLRDLGVAKDVGVRHDGRARERLRRGGVVGRKVGARGVLGRAELDEDERRAQHGHLVRARELDHHVRLCAHAALAAALVCLTYCC